MHMHLIMNLPIIIKFASHVSCWMNDHKEGRLVVSLCVVVVHRLVTWMASQASKAK
jgi:hypothetical protein